MDPAPPTADTESLAIDVAQQARLTYKFVGPLRVLLWPQQGDEPHPVSLYESAPDHAEVYEYGAVGHGRPNA
ncbi:hypothetical protein ACFUIZ_18880 [Streptomyces cinereoruber]|uniref:hypothetical protein n=1 Tax=Streptomyces cinereoruber TaxID=67260 RepID=UPI00363C254D